MKTTTLLKQETRRIIVAILLLGTACYSVHAQDYVRTFGAETTEEAATCIVPSSHIDMHGYRHFYVASRVENKAQIFTVNELGEQEPGLDWRYEFDLDPGQKNYILDLREGKGSNTLVGGGGDYSSLSSSKNFYFELNTGTWGNPGSPSLNWAKSDNISGNIIHSIQYASSQNEYIATGNYLNSEKARVLEIDPNNGNQYSLPNTHNHGFPTHGQCDFNAFYIDGTTGYAGGRVRLGSTQSTSRAHVTEYGLGSHVTNQKYYLEDQVNTSRFYGQDLIEAGNNSSQLILLYHGSENSTSVSDYQVFLQRIDKSSLNSANFRGYTLDGYSKMKGISVTALAGTNNTLNTGYLVTGVAYNDEHENYDMFVMHVNESLFPQWAKVLNAAGDEFCDGMNTQVAVIDDYVYLVGQTNSYRQNGINDMFFARTALSATPSTCFTSANVHHHNELLNPGTEFGFNWTPDGLVDEDVNTSTNQNPATVEDRLSCTSCSYIKHWGNPSLDESATAVAVGPYNIYVAGQESEQALITAFDKTGKYLWTYVFDREKSDDIIYDLKVDSYGHLFGAGGGSSPLKAKGFVFRFDPGVQQLDWMVYSDTIHTNYNQIIQYDASEYVAVGNNYQSAGLKEAVINSFGIGSGGLGGFNGNHTVGGVVSPGTSTDNIDDIYTHVIATGNFVDPFYLGGESQPLIQSTPTKVFSTYTKPISAFLPTSPPFTPTLVEAYIGTGVPVTMNYDIHTGAFLESVVDPDNIVMGMYAPSQTSNNLYIAEIDKSNLSFVRIMKVVPSASGSKFKLHEMVGISDGYLVLLEDLTQDELIVMKLNGDLGVTNAKVLNGQHSFRNIGKTSQLAVDGNDVYFVGETNDHNGGGKLDMFYAKVDLSLEGLDCLDDYTINTTITSENRSSQIMTHPWVRNGLIDLHCTDPRIDRCGSAVLPDGDYCDCLFGGEPVLPKRRPTGIHDDAFENTMTNVTVKPNPSSGLFTLTGLEEAPVFVQIFNAQGKVILEQHIENPVNYTFDLKDQAVGIYFMRLHQNGKMHSMKMVKE